MLHPGSVGKSNGGVGGVCVVGAGVIGLTTAIRVAEAGRTVRIVASERSPRTTSDVAGAVWFPFLGGEAPAAATRPTEPARSSPPAATPPTEAAWTSPAAATRPTEPVRSSIPRALEWGRRSLEVFRALSAQRGAGIVWRPGIELFTSPTPEDPWWRPAVADFRRARPEDLPAGFADGYVFEVPVVRMPVYLRWLEQRFLSLGGTIEERTIDDLDTLLRDAPVVVNCTGIGARALTGDTDLHPVRGQVVRVAPGIASRFLGAENVGGGLAYVIPHADCTVLGGTEDENAWNLDPDPGVAAAIIDRCAALVPQIAKAPVLGHAAGLRPVRSAVRLETEQRAAGIVVHHYGHGGSGVTYSWGCAEEAARLVEEAMRDGA